MFERYAELIISVEPKRDDSYPLSVKSPGGDARGTLRLPTSDAAFQALLGRLAALDTDEDALAQIGQKLFTALFLDNPDIRLVYGRTQGRLQPDEGLRITFYIGTGEAEVAALPWEFLWDPDQIGPMATLDAPIVRYLPQSSVLPSLQANLPLRVLLTGAATEPKPDVEGALRQVEAALKNLGQRVEITVEPHLTRAKFQNLLRKNFHIWHFVGHGEPATGRAPGALRFEDATGDAEPVSARDLGILLNRNSIRLIVLNACDSAKLSVDPFLSIAPALIKAQIPGVIAMQLRVAQDAALAFSTEFYRTLTEGAPLDTCVTEGRKGIIGVAGLRNPDWGIPVVYTRAEEGGRLFDLPTASATTPAATASPGGISIDLSGSRIDNSSVGINNIGNTATGGNTASANASDEDEMRALQIDTLKGQIAQKRRRLYALQIQAARYGINVPAEITLEIEDLEGRKDYRGNIMAPGEIAKLEQDLKRLLDQG